MKDLELVAEQIAQAEALTRAAEADYLAQHPYNGPRILCVHQLGLYFAGRSKNTVIAYRALCAYVHLFNSNPTLN